MVVQINLNLPKGQTLAKRLIAISDIVIDNFAPRVMETWGLSYEELVKVKPDIIVAKMPMMGKTGPNRITSALATLGAVSGINHLAGMPDDLPVGTCNNLPDYSCNPCHAAVALLAALRYRRQTGRGQFIELSQFESTVNVLKLPFSTTLSMARSRAVRPKFYSDLVRTAGYSRSIGGDFGDFGGKCGA